MKPHPRIRKTIKWGGAALTVLLVVVWIGSGWWHLDCWASKSAFEISVRTGSLSVVWGPAIDFPANDADRLSLEKGWRIGSVYAQIGRFYDNGFYLSWWYWGSWSKHQPYLRSICVPHWVFVALVLVVTAIAWRMDTVARRRARLNLCPKCNYDRAGLAAGAVCPECGHAAPA